MDRKIAGLGAVAALIAVVAFAQTSQGQDVLARVFGGAPEPEALTDKNSGQAVTLEAVQKEAVWRKETADKLRELD